MRTLFIALLAISLPALADSSAAATSDDDCGSWPETSTMRQGCIANLHAKDLDAQLNSAYEYVLQLPMFSGTPSKEALIAAERAWIRYRDATCHFENTIGGANGVSSAECYERLTAERLVYIRALE